MIEISIPQAGEETKQAKDLVFSILSKKQPLSIIEIHNIIKKNYTISLTYHAVKKGIDTLLKKEILVKEKKKYHINKTWLIEHKRQIDKLLTQYEKDKDIKSFDKNRAGEQYATYTFSNLIDCDQFWDDLLFYLAKHIKKDEEHEFLVHTHYNWWYLINYGQETKLHKYMIKHKFNTHFLIIGNSPLNKWAKKIYESIGVNSKIIEDKKFNNKMTLNILGDVIIQTFYPKEIMKLLKEIYSNYNNTQEIPLKKITELANKTCDIKLNVFKNREIANSLREKYLKYF